MEWWDCGAWLFRLCAVWGRLCSWRDYGAVGYFDYTLFGSWQQAAMQSVLVFERVVVVFVFEKHHANKRTTNNLEQSNAHIWSDYSRSYEAMIA